MCSTDANPESRNDGTPEEFVDRKTGIKFRRSKWYTGTKEYEGILVISSTGEVVTRIPQRVRTRDRSKYRADGTRRDQKT